MFDHAQACVYDRLCRTIVPFQIHFLEIVAGDDPEHFVAAGATKTIDALIGIACHTQVAVFTTKHQDKFQILFGAVLILITDNILIFLMNEIQCFLTVF